MAKWQDNDICVRFHNGEKVESIARSHGIKPHSVYGVCRRYGLQRRQGSVMFKRRDLTDSEINGIVSDRKANVSLMNLRTKYKIPLSQVRDILCIFGMDTTGKREAEVKEMSIRLFKEGKTLNEIARAVKSDHYVVKRVLKENGYNTEERYEEWSKEQGGKIKKEAYIYADDYNAGMNYGEIAKKHGVKWGEVYSSGLNYLVYPRGKPAAFTDGMFIRSSEFAEDLGKIEKEVKERYRRLVLHRALVCYNAGRRSDIIVRLAKLAEKEKV